MALTLTRIDGMEDALRQFRRAPELVRQYVGDAVQETEITLVGKVRRAAPRDTGALQLSIGSKTVGLKASITIEEGELYGRRPSVYWRFVEYGSIHNQPARPFIRPASEAEQQPFIERVKSAAKRMERELDTA